VRYLGKIIDRSSGVLRQVSPGYRLHAAASHGLKADIPPIGGIILVGWQVMNEVSIHRGRYPHLSVVDAYVDGEHLTEAVVSSSSSQLPLQRYLNCDPSVPIDCPGRRAHPSHPNGFDSLLPLLWRADRSSGIGSLPFDPHRP
jgi:hypothetical protein